MNNNCGRSFSNERLYYELDRTEYDVDLDAFH